MRMVSSTLTPSTDPTSTDADNPNMGGHNMAHEEDWETGSGLALDGATVTVTALEFGFNASIGAGVTCANFEFTDDDGEVIEQSFSCGKNFEANRDGTELTGNGKLNRNSNFGMLIESLKAVLDNPGDTIGSPKVAENWVGHRFEFGTVEVERKNPTTGVTSTKSAFIITGYAGTAEGGEVEAAAPAAKPAAAKTGGVKKAAAPKAAGGAAVIGEELWNGLVELASNSEDHDAFVNAALDWPEVDTSKDAKKLVMGTGAGSVWASRTAA